MEETRRKFRRSTAGFPIDYRNPDEQTVVTVDPVFEILRVVSEFWQTPASSTAADGNEITCVQFHLLKRNLYTKVSEKEKFSTVLHSYHSREEVSNGCRTAMYVSCIRQNPRICCSS